MSHDRLAQLIQARREAIDADPEHAITHETILSIFTSIAKGAVTEGLALRLLRSEAMRVANEPDQATLYRQAAADIWQMQREEQ